MHITPFLWFEKDAAAAAQFYIDVAGKGKITSDSPMVVRFELLGQEFLALNGGKQDFEPTESVSFLIACETQAEIDRLWAGLCEGGEPGRCGWLKDKYGFSWQVVPDRINEWLGGDDEDGSQRAFAAMMKMSKLDMSELQRAYAGT